jgi:hypothetical protein
LKKQFESGILPRQKETLSFGRKKR